MTISFTFLNDQSMEGWTSFDTSKAPSPMYGGTWLSKKYVYKGVIYYFARVLEELRMGDKYSCKLLVLSPSEFRDYTSMGRDIPSYEGVEWDSIPDRNRVEWLIDQGVCAEMGNWTGNSYSKLFGLCSRRTEIVSGLFELEMEVPQNRIGATGWDLVKGNSYGTKDA